MSEAEQSTTSGQLGILRLAEANEVSTRRFYLAAAARLKSPAALELVKSLATDEAVHQRVIAEQIRSLEAGAGWAAAATLDTPVDGKAELPSRVHALERELRPEDSEQDVILYALRLEMNSHSFYHDAAEGAPNPAARDLYLRLAAMERQHFENLMLAYEDLVRFAPQTDGS
jgi:rubrerythrin